MIERFGEEDDYLGNAGMTVVVPKEDGEFVSYEDYLAFKLKVCKVLQSSNEEELDALYLELREEVTKSTKI